MAKQIDANETVALDELVMTEVITNQAIINLLIEKGILTKDEIVAEIERIQKG